MTVKAQEQLCIAMEVEHREAKLWLWGGEVVKTQQEELSRVVVSDKVAVVEAAGQAAGVIGLWYCNVSSLSDFFSLFEFNLSLF